MKIRVTGKQESSRMCFICGLKNAAGLRAEFYELESGELAAMVAARDEHQSYPGRLHGGISAALLDETIGRAIMMRYKGEVWGVTVDFSMRLRKPVPTDVPLRVIGRIVNEGSRIFEGTGEILLPDGTVAVEATGKYIKMPIEKIADFDRDHEEWMVVPHAHDPAEIEVGPAAGPAHPAAANSEIRSE